MRKPLARVSLTDKNIHIGQYTLPIARLGAEFGAVAEKDPAGGVFQHSPSNADLLPVAVRDDPIIRKRPGREKGEIRTDLPKNPLGILPYHTHSHLTAEAAS